MSEASTPGRSDTRAPAASYAASVNPAATPAPDSTETENPIFLSFSVLSGVAATRVSPAEDSLGIPIIIAIACTPEDPGQRRKTLFPTIVGVYLLRRENRPGLIRKITELACAQMTESLPER